MLAEVRKRGFKSAAWIESDTCRGKPEFGMRIYLMSRAHRGSTEPKGPVGLGEQGAQGHAGHGGGRGWGPLVWE